MIASTGSLAKSPAASFIALYAGIIGLVVFGGDRPEMI